MVVPAWYNNNINIDISNSTPLVQQRLLQLLLGYEIIRSSPKTSINNQWQMGQRASQGWETGNKKALLFHKSGFWGSQEKLEYLRRVPTILQEVFPVCGPDWRPSTSLMLPPTGPQMLGEAKARNTLKQEGQPLMPSLEWDKSEVSLCEHHMILVAK